MDEVTRTAVEPPRRALFTDERGVGLRTTWHTEHEMVVLSLWHGDRCTGTFRLPISEAGRLATFLVEHLGEAARTQQAPASRSARTRCVERHRARRT